MLSSAVPKPRGIALVDFQEEITPTGWKLLHCIFRDRKNWTYKWTPPWKSKREDPGFERMLFKVLEVEEWNAPKGVWSEELQRAAEEIPLLKEFQLLVLVTCGDLVRVPEPHWSYRFEVQIDGAPENDRVYYDEESETFRVADCHIHYARFKDEFLEEFDGKWHLQISQHARAIWEGSYGDPYASHPPLGVLLSVWIPEGLERQHLRVIGRDVATFVRSYLRRVLRDYAALKKGFED